MSYPTTFSQPLLEGQYQQDIGITNGTNDINLPLQEFKMATSKFLKYNPSTTSNPSPHQRYGNTSPQYSNTSPQYGNVSPPYGNVSPQYSNTSSQYGQTSSPSYGNLSSPYASDSTTNTNQLSPLAEQKPLQQDNQSYIPAFNAMTTPQAGLPYDLQTPELGVNDGIFRISHGQYNNPMTPAGFTNPQQKFPAANNFPIKLEYKKFPTKLYKTQKRARGLSQQRVEGGELQFILDFQDVVTINLVKSIQVFVKRTNEVRNTPQFVGPVTLTPRYDMQQNTKYLITVDLDSVYESSGKKVYKLQKTLTDELNTFHLAINVILQDGRRKSLKTKEILLIGKKTVVGEKRPAETPRRGSRSSEDSLEPLCKATSLSSGYISQHEDEDILRARKIVTTHIQTKSMEVGGILVNNIIQTPHGDIAYHFPLNNSTETFEEGEIVGLLHSSIENQLQIVRLTSKNISQAVLKGVITRSQYLEAMIPDERTVSETICMYGVVPIKVQGSVEVNEAFYASPDHPGVATSQFNLTYNQMSDASLIGYAFQSHAAQSENEISMVQAGISVLSCASQSLLNKRIRDMEKKWSENITKLKKSNQRFKKCMGPSTINFVWKFVSIFIFDCVSFCTCLICTKTFFVDEIGTVSVADPELENSFLSCGILSTLIAALLGILLWQLLLPGSAYRYYMCKKGSIAGHTSYFNYNPGYRTFNHVLVNGIEFTFENLMKKKHVDHTKLNITGARYYLNVDLCAYGGQRSTRDATTGQKRVYGPEFYAVDGQCNKVYSIFGGSQKWMDYSVISWPEKQNITVFCKP